MFALGADLVDLAPSWENRDRIAAAMPVEMVLRGGYGADAGLIMPTICRSNIRARIMAGAGTDDLLPAGIARCIRRSDLYMG